MLKGNLDKEIKIYVVSVIGKEFQINPIERLLQGGAIKEFVWLEGDGNRIK